MFRLFFLKSKTRESQSQVYRHVDKSKYILRILIVAPDQLAHCYNNIPKFLCYSVVYKDQTFSLAVIGVMPTEI